MPILELKSYVAIPFLAAGIVAVLMMFDLMGRSERKLSPNFLRRGHRLAGFIFVLLLGVLSYLCIEYVAAVGDRMSHRAIFHSVLVFFTSAGYFFLRDVHEHGAGEVAEAEEVTPDPIPGPEGDPASGETVYSSNCASCHAADSEDWFIGPGLKGILVRETLPESGRPATPENVRSQITNPVGAMPAFTSFSDRQMVDLLAYIETL